MKLSYMLLTVIITVALAINFSSVVTEANTSASQGLPQLTVVPNVNLNTAATGSFLGPLANSQRTYQLLIDDSQLLGIVGQDLQGLSWRIPTSATTNWPLSDVTYSAYDIYISGCVDPVNRSLTFANNIVGPQTQVRSGSLTILANSYTFGNNPNTFGTEITFNAPYHYSGGNLLIEIRHAGFTGTSRALEATTTSTTGYGTLFSGCWTGSYTGTAGVQGNFSTLRLSSEFLEPYLQLGSLIEGLYNANTNLMVKDTARVYLRNNSAPYAVIDSSKSVLDSLGKGGFTFLNASNGVNYYVVVTQRNSISTWSSDPLSFTGNFLAYNYTTSDTMAFGNNMKLKGSRWTNFSGDIDRDGTVDVSDIVITNNDAANFASGYIVSDVNGDEFTDVSDIVIVYNNAANFVQEITP